MFGTLYIFTLLGLVMQIVERLHLHAGGPAHRLREPRLTAMALSPLNRRRLANFRANRRGWWSLWIFAALFCLTLFAEFIANDRPLVARVDGRWFVPVLADYAESDILPDGLPTDADWHDPIFRQEIEARGWMVWPPIPYAYATVVRDLDRPAPAPPSARNWLGTDDQSRDVLARVIYGFRISVLFGFTLTIVASVVGIAAGAVQGFYGGLTDLLFQRFIEIWAGHAGALPADHPGQHHRSRRFWILLGFLLLFSWMGLTGVVRAEFLRGRNLDYVRAARALGVSDARLMARHILPNAMVATLTFLPFILSGSVTVLASLDFLGFGLPPGSRLARRAGGAGQEQPPGALARAARGSSCWAAC